LVNRMHIRSAHRVSHYSHLCQLCLAKEPRQLTPYPPIANTVAKEIEQCPRERPVRRVNYKGFPVWLEGNEPRARTRYAKHLPEDLVGIVYVLKGPLAATPVKGIVGKVQVMRVPDIVLYRQIRPLRSLARLGNHGLATIYPNDSARDSYYLC
jgi:hypothetical protein